MMTLTEQIEAYFDGRLDAQAVAELQQQLRGNREAQRQYLIWATLQSELAWQHRAGAEVFSSQLKIENARPASALAPQRRPSVWRLGAMALAAMITLAITAWLVLAPEHPQVRHEPTRGLAMVTDAERAVFSDSASNMDLSPTLTALGAELSAGPLRLESGKLQVMFKSGAVVDVIGPADFDIVGPNRGHLSRGTVVAYVPAAAHGFTLTAPHGAEVIDLGTRFALRVGEGGDSRVDVLTGRVIMSINGLGRTIAAGQAWTADADGDLRQVQWDAEPWVLADVTVTDPIPLGNLFDDTADQPLETAISTDGYQAAADVADLGVDRVIQGGEAMAELAPGVKVDLSTLGWSALRYGTITNDGWNGAGESDTGAISTTGKLTRPTGLVEQGIGMHANAVIVFDLAELRRAGRLHDKLMRFVSDRAGINDDAFGDVKVHARLAAVVIGPDGILDAQVNGRMHKPRLDQDGLWRFDTLGASDVVLADGRYVRFDLPIAPQARYLALIATGADDVDGNIGHDHTVFSGARLEITP